MKSVADFHRLALATCLLCALVAFTASKPARAAPPDFGPNVLVFSPSMSMATIQSAINSVFAEQVDNQFGSRRFALLFKPGIYNLDIPVGYYTQLAGLGTSPDDTLINGYVQCTDSSNGNALDNFWRGAENMEVNPLDSGGTDMWAVSQACPLRRMHIEGNLALSDYGGYASGGFMADSLVDGEVDSWSQQQWLSRNDQYSGWSNGVWNQVFVGDVGAPSQSFPNPPYTTIPATPIIREKPFLIYGSGGWGVFVPALRSQSAGVSWNGVSGAAGSTIALSAFYIAHSKTDTAETINAALAQGKDILLTPGVYVLDAPITVTKPDTIVLGIGIATLRPVGGAMAMSVSDVDGVDVSGILFDAGTVSSPALLQIGPPNSTANHTADPITLHDDFFRVGGEKVGRVTTCLEINSADVVGDDFWIWRADHGSGVGWYKNTARNGLIVNGENDIIYGLAVEHFQRYQTLWNGNGGQVYMYQSEAPYDPPSQAAWMAGKEDGYASYKVAAAVTSHRAYGLGIYCYFDLDPGIILQNAIEAPQLPAVQFYDMVTVSLGGIGAISNIIDNTGGAVDSSNLQADLAAFP